MSDLGLGNSDFQNHSDIKWNGTTGVVEYGGDKNMICMFYNKSVHNPAKSTQAGTPQYEDVVFVKIHPPGERLNIIDRPATQSDTQRFPTQWNQFQQKQEQIPEGTPIDLLFPEQPSIASTLRAVGVHTIEQCAELSAHAIDNIPMGGQSYVNAAVKYMKAANKGVTVIQFRKELEEKDQQIKLLSRQVDELKATINQFQGKPNQPGAAPVPTLAQMQEFIAQQMGRPENLPSTKFDPQATMIAGTHESRTKPKTKAPTGRMVTKPVQQQKVAEEPKRRSRERLRA